MNVEELQSSLVLNAVNEIGPARYQSLIKSFGSAESALESGLGMWIGTPLFDVETVKNIESSWDEALARADDDWQQVQKENVRVYLWQEGPYPRILKEIHHAPPVLYVKGADIAIESPRIALVGSRKCSYYGEKMARLISSGLAQAGVITVSGLARGIDTHAHQATLESEGATWAVIGSGLAKIYPPENRALARTIEESGGAVISEFSMKTMPLPPNFPRRNRVIAGISLATVIVEGGEKSGSLITARLAVEEGRDVLAVPGPVTSHLSAAPHMLLKMGAAMVQSAQDVLIETGLASENGASKHNDEENENIPETYRQVLTLLGAEPVPKDILAERLNKEPNVLSSLLLEMELRGLLRTMPGGSVTKT